MKRLFVVALVALVTASLATPASAQRRHRARAHLQDKREMRDDRHDKNQYKHLLEAFLAAKKAGQKKRLINIDTKVMAAMRDEKQESRAEAGADTREVKRDRKAMRRRKHLGGKIAAGASLVDDKRDRAKERGQLHAMSGLAAQYKPLVGKTDPASLAAKEKLIRRLVGSQRKEIGANKAERKEDHRARRPGRVR